VSGNGSAGDLEAFDRLRRRVLWALPTGLFVVGSRAADARNLMTCNWVMQVATSPKLVAVAVESGSMTRDLIERGGSFSVCLLARSDRGLVRRFVKPVRDIEIDAAGVATAMQGEPVFEVDNGLPCLATSVAWLACSVRSIVEWDGLQPAENGSGSLDSPTRRSAGRSAGGGAVGRPKIDPESEYAVLDEGLGVAQHGVVHEVHLGLLHEALAVRTLDGRKSPVADGLSPGAETCHHLLGIEFVGHGPTVAATSRGPVVPRPGGGRTTLVASFLGGDPGTLCAGNSPPLLGQGVGP
jgi:flavin reductase (DIM6/NTAB) family NADH-FMN oxidoreductase RutF